ncbi:MAG: DUF120 domain-containing protein [Sulfolobales archaeon]|nr:CTP-dependent riboflavin kinase [Sulfolobales archaeon]MDW8010233.1 DUF120 domain-containing protein [Sulfolobales archaeon]
MLLEGRVTSGLGVGRVFVGKHVYYVVLTEILGEEPYLGTLNIEVNLPVDEVESCCRPHYVKSVVSSGSVLGGFKYWFGRVGSDPHNSIRVLVLRPSLSKHDSRVLEIVSSKYLREVLGLKDGDRVYVELMCR